MGSHSKFLMLALLKTVSKFLFDMLDKLTPLYMCALFETNKEIKEGIPQFSHTKQL